VTAGNIQLELSIPWIVETSIPNVTACGTAGDTDPNCVVGPTAMPTLPSTSVLAQDSSTSPVGTTVKPFVSATTMTHSPVETPSVPSRSTATPSTAPSSTTPPAGCTVGGTSCIVYLGAGLGALAVIVVLLVVTVIVLLLRRGKKKGKGERKVSIGMKSSSWFQGVVTPIALYLELQPGIVILFTTDGGVAYCISLYSNELERDVCCISPRMVSKVRQ